MVLIGDMTIEELVLFYFSKEIHLRFHHTMRWSKINIVAPYHTSQHPRVGHKHLLPTKVYLRLLSQNIPTNSKRHRAQGCTLGSCIVLT
jgi:hypothetical protein